MIPVDPFVVVNILGLIAFAFVGGMKAIRKGFDPFGVAVVGIMTALGGGTTRDVLVNRVPISLQSAGDVTVSLLGVGLAIYAANFVNKADRHPIVLLADALGLAAFATTGAIVATETGLSVFGVAGLALVNAVGGGVLADILLDQTPFVLVEDIYATCALIGGAVYWIVSVTEPLSSFSALICTATVLSIRVTAIYRDWQLPTITGISRGDSEQLSKRS
ncbi:trimeric intracellular cation channel family protein [Haladaptatus cibarius]|uniref:trimeric intracellular cation channel family protein n=1 Tax=Haladaptatus cibarius TaxID=453847 RepID=UPI000679B78A|nr:TRIC cation channel family protein [Haladaptatus cibarius]